MTCQMNSGSAQCMESGGNADTENESAVDDSDIGTDVEKVVSEPTASICNCVGKIFWSKSAIDWMRDSCVANVDESCLSCLDEKVGAGDCAELVPAATALAMVECADRCPQSVTTMTDKNQCLDTILLSASKFPGPEETKEQFAECFCSECFSSIQKCLSNQSCAAAWACLATAKGAQEMLCIELFGIFSSLEEESAELTDVTECIATSPNCFAYMGDVQESK
jgi:hypothetical protein